MIPQSVINLGHHAVKHYEECIENGCTPQFAEMVTLGQPPVYRGSDQAFMSGRLTAGGDTLLPDQRLVAEREAKAAGINTSGRFYMGGIADKRQYRDPEAWVGSRDDVISTAKRRRLQLQGQINYTPSGNIEPKRKEISKRALRELSKKERAENPELSQKDAEERVKDKYIPKWKRRRK